MQNEHMNALIDTEDWVSRTQERLLMTPCRPQITTPLFLLMLSGQASPFLHNGIMEPEDSDFEGGWNWGDGKVTAGIGAGILITVSTDRSHREERNRLPLLEQGRVLNYVVQFGQNLNQP